MNVRKSWNIFASVGILLLISFFAIVASAFGSVTPLAQVEEAVRIKDDKKLAQLAYEYAYSIDEAYKYFYQTVVKVDYPLNQFQNIRTLADHTYTAHPTINNDTLHLMGWMDVATEPVMITIPDHDEGRYWLFHTMNMQHFTDSAFGSPQRGTQGGIFMYALEGWQGDVPNSVDEVIYVEHPLIKMMGRIMDLGGDDSPKALKLMDHWSVRTLSEFLGQKGPEPKQRVYPNPEKTNWVQRTNFILSEGTMRKHDEALLKHFKQFGLGGSADIKLRGDKLKAIEQAEENGLEHIQNAPFTDSRDLLGTREEMSIVPSYQHAYGTYIGQWGLPAEHTMYEAIFVDKDGDPLDGSQYDYTVTFEAPEVSGFWSYTVYSAKTRLMSENRLNRHSRSDRTLKANKDGTYTIVFSSDVEKQKNSSSFQPIPNEGWYAVLRMYAPGDSVRNNEWKSVPFSKVDK